MDHGLAQLLMRTDHNNGSLQKARRRRQREHHLKLILRVFKAVMRPKNVLIVLE